MQKMTAFIAAAVMTTGVVSAPVMAQDTADSGAQTQSAQNFSDDQLQSFADASQDIAMISQDYTEQLQGAAEEGDQEQIREQANEEMMQAVQDNGMSVDQFNSIGQAIQQDPQLMQRVQGMVQPQPQ